MSFPELPAVIPVSIFLLLAVEWYLTQRRVRRIQDLPEPREATPLPTVCLCVPARNEAEEIGAALDSWLAQDFPGLRIVVVDDGSTDATPGLLAQRAADSGERLRVLRNDTLPPGWLGKNHALHLAVASAEAQTAEWLVFADADVQADPLLLRRAFAYMEQQPADVLALCPAIDLGSCSEALFLPMGAMGFLWLVPPERVADPGSGFFCGIGAFTLIRRTAYDAIGGHAAAPMEAVDDMLLARRAKRAGFSNRVAMGGPGLHLRMYHGLAELVRSMRKNALAFPWVWAGAPLWILVVLVLFSSPILLALGGWPIAGLLLWLLWPPMIAEAHQRTGPRAVQPIWMLWPLAGPILAAGLAWAFWDRLRGINHWRGRSVRL
jgi:glycosyltransferase involved in cell wall biosynthesis